MPKTLDEIQHDHSFARPLIYKARFDAEIPTEIPAIHQAMLDKDTVRVKQLLEADPELIFAKDAFDMQAQALGEIISPEILRCICDARTQLLATKSNKDYQARQRAILDTWEKTKTHPYYPHIDPVQAVQRYLDYCTRTQKPTRNELHQACIDGDLDKVKRILSAEPERINELDPGSYTPVALAAANGHFPLVKWLLEQRAEDHISFKRDHIGLGVYCDLLDNAATPAIVELVLRHKGTAGISMLQDDIHDDTIDGDAFVERLFIAITQNDTAMAECLLYYVYDLPSYDGKSLLELVIKKSGHPDYGHKTGYTMLALFLKFYNKPIEIVQNKFLIPAVYAQLMTHNARLEKRVQTKKPLQLKAQYLSQTGRGIETEFSADELEVHASMKPVSDLTPGERAIIRRIFFDTFEMRENHCDATCIDYIEDALADHDNPNSFITLFTINGEIVSFLTFEIEEKTRNNFILFHAKLAANTATGASLGLTNLGMRIMLALEKAVDKTVFFAAKAIYPGYGLCIFPKDLQFFPKVTMPADFIADISKHMRDPVADDGETIPAKLKVKPHRLPRVLNLPLSYYRHRTGADPQHAMMIVFEIDHDVQQQYLELFEPFGITDENLNELSHLFKRVLQFRETKIKSWDIQHPYIGNTSKTESVGTVGRVKFTANQHPLYHRLDVSCEISEDKQRFVTINVILNQQEYDARPNAFRREFETQIATPQPFNHSFYHVHIRFDIDDSKNYLSFFRQLNTLEATGLSEGEFEREINHMLLISSPERIAEKRTVTAQARLIETLGFRDAMKALTWKPSPKSDTLNLLGGAITITESPSAAR